MDRLLGNRRVAIVTSRIWSQATAIDGPTRYADRQGDRLASRFTHTIEAASPYVLAFASATASASSRKGRA